MRKFYLVIFLLIFPAVCFPTHSKFYGYERSFPILLSLSGKWKMKLGNVAPTKFYVPSIDDTQWKEIYVPANWYLQGLEYSGVVWFRKHFTVDPCYKGKIVKIIFSGVDYIADVWLNGHYIGFHEGYFAPFSFIINDLLKFGKEDNILVVRVNSPYEEPGKYWGLRKRLIKGVLNHHDTRPGGAWSLRGQEKNTGGIWAPVYLRISKEIAIESVRIDPELDPVRRLARPKINLQVYSSKGKKFIILLSIEPYNFLPNSSFTQRIIRKKLLRKGKNRFTFVFPPFHVKLWWPWDHGFPHLYQLTVIICQGKEVLDTKKEIFGFRTVECNPEDMLWKINGKRLFLRGTNYISTQWLSEMNKEKYLYDLMLMKRANINVVRVHAHIEAPQFYNACDELGMMVWQDFPLQWGYTDEPAFIKEAKKQALEMVHLLYNHPSIIAWCAHNEPPWDAFWMKYKYQDYNPEQNKVVDDYLYRCLKEADMTRYVHKASSTKEHPWFGWYSGVWKDYAKPSRSPFITEFGAQALPGLDSLQKIFKKANPWPKNEEDWKQWEYHNFQRHETFDIAKVSMGKDIQEFISNTQKYQAKLIKLAAESYRRQKYNPVTGIFQFMFCEDWPSINWGIVDYWRNPKLGYNALKVAYQPILPSIEWKKEEWKEEEIVEIGLWIINDLPKAYKNATVKYSLIKGQRSLKTKSIKVNIEPDSAKKILTIKEKLASGSYELVVFILDSTNECLGKNNFNFKVIGK